MTRCARVFHMESGEAVHRLGHARLLVVAAASAALLTGCDEESAGGAPEVGTSIEAASEREGSYVVTRGVPFTDGALVLRVPGSESVEILEVGIDGDPGLELLGASVSFREDPRESSQDRSAYPPKSKDLGKIVPAVGLTLDSDADDAFLLVGLKASRAGLLRVSQVFIDYKESGETYRAAFPARLTVCTDETALTDAICAGMVEEAPNGEAA